MECLSKVKQFLQEKRLSTTQALQKRKHHPIFPWKVLKHEYCLQGLCSDSALGTGWKWMAAQRRIRSKQPQQGFQSGLPEKYSLSDLADECQSSSALQTEQYQLFRAVCLVYKQMGCLFGQARMLPSEVRRGELLTSKLRSLTTRLRSRALHHVAHFCLESFAQVSQGCIC